MKRLTEPFNLTGRVAIPPVERYRVRDRSRKAPIRAGEMLRVEMPA